jgi:hypothetical protein
MREHSKTRPARLVALVLLAVMMTACQPSPEQLQEPPTLAVLPTLPPTQTPEVTPTWTLTPTATLTPSVTPTPAASRTPFPTFTPVSVDVGAACAELYFSAIAFTRSGCFGQENGEICAGPGVREVQVAENVSGSLLRRPGNTTFANDIRAFQTDYTPTDNLFGLALVYLGGDMERAFGLADRLAMIVYGGTTVRNLVNDPTADAVRPLASGGDVVNTPFSRIELTSESLDPTCNFLPTGMVIQTTAPALIEVNNVRLRFDGTIHIGATAAGSLDVSNLAGIVEMTYRARREPVQLGVTARVPLDSALFPLQGPILREPLDPALQNAIFARGGALLGELPREVEAPPVVSSEELALFNTVAGEWFVETEITFLSGLYQQGEAVTVGLARDVVNLCEWQGAWVLATENYSAPFLVLQDVDGQAITVNAFYPDVVFPDVMERQPGAEDLYAGTALNVDGTLFEHQILFETPTRMSWSVDVEQLGSGVCREGRIEGVGSREPQTVEAAAQAQLSATTWRVQLVADPGTVPLNDPIVDCPGAAGFEPPLTDTIVGTTLPGDGSSLRLQGQLDGVPFPDVLTTTPLNPDSYVGVALTEAQQVFHEVRFDGDLLNWRMMIRSLTDGCRVGTIQAVGSPLVAN